MGAGNKMGRSQKITCASLRSCQQCRRKETVIANGFLSRKRKKKVGRG
jgi:hypothetical protein